MKKRKTTIFTLLSEELDSKKLMNLSGGANAHPIPTFPHDLITPSSSSDPYSDDDIDE
ncbi:hypothetical protein [uncultured Kordia sp.]|uniref:hypothetical protein n=1 Tax=uncultured Kordia sp. TaxID=507699 RepID=UPI0026057E27|nr:hypothetical protein [uncultured Kordia sp.]